MKKYSNGDLTLDDLLQDANRHLQQLNYIAKECQLRGSIKSVREIARSCEPLYSALLDSDSQAARLTHRNYECMTTIADETLWCATCAARAEYLRGRSDAATSMRDKCVEKLRAIAADYDNVAQPNTGAAISKQAVLYAARQIQSLTLDPLEPEKRGVD